MTTGIEGASSRAVRRIALLGVAVLAAGFLLAIELSLGFCYKRRANARRGLRRILRILDTSRPRHFEDEFMARRSTSPADVTAKPQPSGRKTTRQVAAHFPEEVAWQLRELAAERRTTIQALIAEALDGLFQKYGKPEIAQGEKGRAT